ncbi:MAG: putative porin [Woeseiaceae bacterium]|nr:putative porin [Woeseiaceae bacterium]
MLWLSPKSATAADTVPWYEQVTLAGDIRLRYETISLEGAPDKERGRYRGRLGLTAPLHETVRLVVRLATSDGSPDSTNLNFDDGFAVSNIRIDRAYVDWRINSSWQLQAGKLKAPWFRSGGNALLWDSDFNPEGLAATFRTGRMFGSAAALRMEPGPAGDDSLLLTVQGGLDMPLGNSRSLITGAGYYDYANTAGNVPFHNGSPGGNSNDASGNYRYDYAMLELFAQYKTALGSLPASLFGAWVRNTAIGAGDTAYALGVKIGQHRGAR